MKKQIIILIAFLTLSCASVKKDKLEIKSDSTSDENTAKITITTDKEEGLIYKPFNPDKPMLIGKDTVYNTIVEKYYKDRVQVVKDTIVKREAQVIEIDSKVKETDNSKLYLYLFGGLFGLIGLIVIVGMIWINGKFKTAS